jgi:hypothetical protein
MAVVAVLVFVAAYILIATERVPKSRALLLADLSGRGFCSGSKTREGGPMDGKCKPEAAHSSHVCGARMRARMRVDGGLREVGPGCQGLRRAGTGSPAKCSARSNALA